MLTGSLGTTLSEIIIEIHTFSRKCIWKCLQNCGHFVSANADKFQGIVLPGSRNNANVQVSLGGVDLAFVKKIDVVEVCIDGKLNFNDHVHRICSKASSQISALQRLTGLVDYQSRKAIYTSFIASNFNYCPLVWFFTSRESINKIDKIQERALRFVLKDHTSSYNDL